MPRVVIDNREVEVPPGATILQAARKLAIDVPTLCLLDGCRPMTSCMVCLVKLADEDRFVPSCATLAEDGMRIESETEAVRQVRRVALDLLLSDHAGECRAPCQNTCPTHMDIPLMMRQVAAGDIQAAIATVKHDIPLPAVLGRVCPELCEHACRRGAVDGAASICLLKRHVADQDLASGSPYLPRCEPSNGKRVAIVGAGPAGLASAFHLLQRGYACTLFDEGGQAGGRLRTEFDETQLPRDVLDSEIGVIEKMGARFELATRVGADLPLAALRKQFDAVLLTVGRLSECHAEALDVEALDGRVVVNSRTHEVDTEGVFATGDAVHPSKYVVRCIAEGKTAAVCIDQYLSSGKATGISRPFTARLGRLCGEDLAGLMAGVSEAGRTTPSAGAADGLTGEEARGEALRCLQCGCGKDGACRLQRYAEQYGADGHRYGKVQRKRIERQLEHAAVIYEPGKCILCGLCVQIAGDAGERLGLTFIGRGFDVRVGVPLDRSLAEGLERVAERCAEACPTGALLLRAKAAEDA